MKILFSRISSNCCWIFESCFDIQGGKGSSPKDLICDGVRSIISSNPLSWAYSRPINEFSFFELYNDFRAFLNSLVRDRAAMSEKRQKFVSIWLFTLFQVLSEQFEAIWAHELVTISKFAWNCRKMELVRKSFSINFPVLIGSSFLASGFFFYFYCKYLGKSKQIPKKPLFKVPTYSLNFSPREHNSISITLNNV